MTVRGFHGRLCKSWLPAEWKRNFSTAKPWRPTVNGNGGLKDAAGLIIVAPPLPADPFEALKTAFMTARQAGPLLLKTADDGKRALLATVTRLDGGFGLTGRSMPSPTTGGLAALAKTAAIEWDKVICRALDIDPEWKDDDAVAESIAGELFDGAPRPPPWKSGWARNRELVLKMVSPPMAEGKFDPGEEAVFLISGGARGHHCRCRTRTGGGRGASHPDPAGTLPGTEGRAGVAGGG